MVAVADEEAQLEKLEGLEGVQDDVDELWVDLLELGDLGTDVEQLSLVGLADRDQRLVAFELAEKLLYRAIDDGDDVDYLLHDLVLDEDVALGLDDLGVEGKALFQLVHDGVL